MCCCSTACPMLILRNDLAGSSSGFFNRPWTDYQRGFGNCTTLYWIGLDRLHQLTQGNCQVRFELQHRADGIWHYAQYSSFSVGNSSTNYNLNIDGWSGDTGYDAMAYHNGRQFSTYDVDHDTYSDNCASDYGGGILVWWMWLCLHNDINNIQWFRLVHFHRLDALECRRSFFVVSVSGIRRWRLDCRITTDKLECHNYWLWRRILVFKLCLYACLAKSST